MRGVMNAIFASKRSYATLPLFEFMREESARPRLVRGLAPAKLA